VTRERETYREPSVCECVCVCTLCYSPKSNNEGQGNNATNYAYLL